MRPELLPRPADLPEPTHSAEEVREAADDILSRPEYQEATEEPNWIERTVEDIGEWIAGIIEGLLTGTTLGGALPDVVGVIILLLLAAGVAWLVVWAIQSGAFSRPTRPEKDDAVFVDVEEHRTPVEWLTEAERHEREGRWAEGLLCRYRALVTELVDREVIPDVPGRTAGEYVQDMRAAGRTTAAAGGDAAPTFAAATELFEAAWYGGAETGPEERDRFAGLAQRVLAGVRGSAARGSR